MSTLVFSPSQHQASTLYLPPGSWVTVLDCLCAHFPAIDREQWLDRIARGRVLDVPADERERPSIQRTADFFRQAFLADSPIAFLNLDRGALPGLESWHWVSLIAMDHEGDKLTATAADNGQLLGLDIGLWLETTKRSGGFVYLGE